MLTYIVYNIEIIGRKIVIRSYPTERKKMNRKNAREAIAKIAKREGIKESEVRDEMSRAIMAGYNNKETREMWDEIFGEDTIPSPEDFITTIGEIVEK